MAKYQSNIKNILKSKDLKLANEAISKAKKLGYLSVRSQEMISYNFDETKDLSLPFDVDGIQNSDVVGYWDFHWWLPRNWKSLAKQIIDYVIEIKDFFEETYYSLKKYKRFSSYGSLLIKYHPFKVKRSNWIWVVDSKASIINEIKHEMAENQIAQKLGYVDSTDYFVKTGGTVYALHKEKIVKIAKEIENDKAWGEAIKEHNLIQVSDTMWVFESDPTVFVADEEVYGFQLRDGWNEIGIATLVGEWIRTIYGLNFKVKIADYDKLGY